MSKETTPTRNLTWWQLALLGLGFTTGTGFFLGSGLAIERSGFSVLLLFLLAAVGTFSVFSALAGMIAKRPERGSFRTYSKQAFGHWAGFSHGWMYWTSEILILGSQLTGLGLFTKFWFPRFPLWIFSAIYAVLGVLVVLLGTKGFEKTENVLAIVKLSAIIMFIALAFLVFPGLLGKDNAHMHTPTQMGDFFADGFMGMWTGLIYVFFAFAGIEVMGIMATHLHHPQDAPKAGRAMIAIISTLFIISVALVLLLAPLTDFHSDESPFVTALRDLRFHAAVHVFNGVLITAGFSSLVASLFSVSQMAYTIAKDGDAPQFLTKRNKRNVPYGSLVITICGMIVSIVVALLLPKRVYEYITTAGGLMLLYTWLMIVLSSRRLLHLSLWGHIKTWTAIVLIFAATSGTLFDPSSRIGFFASLLFLIIIGIAVLCLRKKWKPPTNDADTDAVSIFSPSKKEFKGLRTKIKTKSNE